jgi:multidrug efflux system membrane fusion protein
MLLQRGNAHPCVFAPRGRAALTMNEGAVAISTSQQKSSRFLPLATGAVCVVAFAGAVIAYMMREGPEQAHAARTPPGVPVSVASATRQDMPVVLTGLGTVQASFTVSIHSQVDGKLQDVLFTEGQRVKKGDVLAKIDPRLYQAALDQAKAKKAQDEAQLTGFQKDMARFNALAAKGFDTQQNLDQQQAKVDTAKATLLADDATIETAQTNLDYTSIVAPSDGRMGVRFVDPGNTVRATDAGAIAVLVRTQPTYVTFTLPAQTLDGVRDAKAKGDVQVIAYDRDNAKILSTGKLETIDNVIDQTTASYKLKAVFTNEDERLWPGEFVNARLLQDVQKQALVIPNSAVQRGPNGVFTWVVGSDNKANPKPIKIGLSANDLTVVAEGINDGDKIVTGGQYKLQTNATVSINQPAPAAKTSPAS